MGGFKWDVVFVRLFSRLKRCEVVRILLVSSNSVNIEADLMSSITIGRRTLNLQSRRMLRTTRPFSSLYQTDIPINELGAFPVKGELVVNFDLKNIEVSDDVKRWEIDHRVRYVTVEVFDRRTIHAWLNENKLGILSPERKRCVDVYWCALAQFWARQCPDRRYWLCRRCGNGTVVVEKCLNDPRVLDSFDDLCDDTIEGCPWVTVFREAKTAGEEFQPIDDDTILIFCKLWEAPKQDLSYHGHLLVKKTMSIPELGTRVAETVTSLRDEDEFGLYVEEGTCPRQISYLHSTLGECGLTSGSILIIRTWQVDGDRSEGLIRQLLVGSDRENGSDPNSQDYTGSEEESHAGQSAVDGTRSSDDDPVFDADGPCDPATVVSFPLLETCHLSSQDFSVAGGDDWGAQRSGFVA